TESIPHEQLDFISSSYIVTSYCNISSCAMECHTVSSQYSASTWFLSCIALKPECMALDHVKMFSFKQCSYAEELCDGLVYAHKRKRSHMKHNLSLLQKVYLVFLDDGRPASLCPSKQQALLMQSFAMDIEEKGKGWLTMDGELQNQKTE
ncbi:hypothetical protein STEG23_034484, partial [Scotinomys teguina]